MNPEREEDITFNIILALVQIFLPGLTVPGADATNTRMYDIEDAQLKKHSVTISGHRTSISLEACFWRHLRAIAKERELSINELVRQLDEARAGSLSGAIRAFVLQNLEKKGRL